MSEPQFDARKWAEDILDNCEPTLEELTANLQDAYAAGLWQAIDQLERDCGTAIDLLTDALPEGAIKREARNRLNLWKSNIRALASRSAQSSVANPKEETK